MKSIRTSIILLILTLLLSSVPTTGLHPTRALEPQVSGALTPPTDSSPHIPITVEVAESMPFSVSSAPPASLAIQSPAGGWTYDYVNRDLKYAYHSSTLTFTTY